MTSQPLSFFFFNDTATTEIYTLSLHDALPIYTGEAPCNSDLPHRLLVGAAALSPARGEDRKSTRLNSSHPSISYAVFCLKKKKTPEPTLTLQKKKQQKT